MKIGINALFLIPGQVGGAETYLRRTLAAMARNHPEHELVVFCNRENRHLLARDLAAGGNVCLIDMHVRASQRAARIVCEQVDLPGVVRRSGVEILWSPGYTMPLRCPCPRLTTVLDLQYRHFPEDFPFVARWATRLLVAGTCRWSERIATISEFARQELIRFTDVAIEQIDVTPLGVDPRFGRPLSGARLADRALALTQSAEPYLLAVSNTYPHKRMEVAVEAFGRLLDIIPHRLVLLGRPRRGEPRVEQAIAALPQPDRVVRLHYVDSEDLVALYQAADLLLFPSCYEGFGLPVAEALAAGLPVVAVRAGAVPEIGGDAVTLVPPGDAAAMAQAATEILRLTPEARANRIQRGRERAARFDWNLTAAATVAACVCTASEGRS